MQLPFMNHRAIVLVVILFVTALFWSATNAGVSAQDRLPKPSGHINDFAAVLDAATRDRLEKILENLKQRTQVDLVIATVKTAGSEDLYDYSLRIANDWNVGAPAGSNKSVLLLIAADNGKFFTQVTRSARNYLPEGLIGNMGQRMRPKLETAGFSEGLVNGIRAFANGVGEIHNFTFADLDQRSGENLIVEQTRPRTIESPAVQPTETPAARATETPTPEPTATVAAVAESPQPTATPAASATPQPSETAPVATPSLVLPAPSPSESPQTTESPAAKASPTVSSEIAA